MLLRTGVENSTNMALDASTEVIETANCYIIAPDNSLKIPVNVRGNGVEVASTGISASISPSSVGILWQTSPDLISLGDMTTDKKVTITANSAAGNAVIAAYSGENQSGNILWSWHIWVTDYDPSTGTTFLINSEDVFYVFMDRNLGATTATPGNVSTLGLLYQWGRKDPFTSGTLTTAAASSLSDVIKNPLIFYTGSDWCTTPNDAFWGGADITLRIPAEKTMFDPSPAGWRVPVWKLSASPWSVFSSSTFLWDDTNSGRTYSDGSFYPTAGYRNGSNGILKEVGKGGTYWSGSPNISNGYYLGFSQSYVNPAYYYSRAFGFSVRCVQE